MFLGNGAFALIMGWLSGYPVGTKIAVNFRENNICSKEECERLLSFTNNSGPLFIVGACGISLFGSSTIGLLLFITHILGALSVGILFRFWKRKKSNFKDYNSHKSDTKLQNITFSNLGEVLGNSIKSSISTILTIGGFIVFFSVILSILNSSKIINLIAIVFMPVFRGLHLPYELLDGFINGLFEITNGINLISLIKLKNISVNIILTSFLLGFGGISIFLQILSIVSKSDLSIKPYIIGKILHGFFAAFYTYIFICVFPIFNFNL